MAAAVMVGEQDDDITDDDAALPLTFAPEVEEAIAMVIPSHDPLDSPDFNPVDYINQLFPTEQSLANIDEKISRMRVAIRRLDGEIREAVRGQTTVGHDGRQSLEEAQRAIQELFVRIRDIKAKANKSEQTVKEITRDIKQLDHAKRHLTTSITTLNHLHMLVGGVETLTNLIKRRQYGETHQLLQAVVNVVDHFKKYHAIPQIRQLADTVHKMQDELGAQIISDFRDIYERQGSRSIPCEQLADACAVVQVLDPRVRDTLVQWYVELQLAEYVVLFHESEEVAWLDKIDRRYAWLKRLLIQFLDEGAKIFPPAWGVDEQICERFCQLTREELSKLMKERAAQLEVKLLLFAIQKTTSFEKVLAQRFANSMLHVEQEEPEMPVEELAEGADQPSEEEPPTQHTAKRESPFLGMISRCFESHLNVYIESQDKNLGELIDRFVQDYKSQGAPTAVVEGGGVVLPSCADLFIFYKKSMVQCSQLSTGLPLLELTAVFKKYLKEYSARLLTANLPKATSGGGFGGLLKETEVKLSTDEVARSCCILSTAEYCLDTTQQLQEKLQERVEAQFRDQIDMNAEIDMFHSIISSSIQLLVQHLETACEPSLTAMVKIHWQGVETVGDQSPYVTQIGRHVIETVPVIRDNLASARKYFTNFCLKFVNSFIPRFINQLYRCKPVSPVGAEQLLLDTHSLKTMLLELPSAGASVSRKAPPSYIKIVTKGLSKAELILKVVMAPHDPGNAFVANYLRLLEDIEQSDFQRVLELKGLKRSEQNQLMDEFRRQTVSKDSAGATADAKPRGPATSRIRKLERLIKKQF